MAKGVVRLPHSWGWTDIDDGGVGVVGEDEDLPVGGGWWSVRFRRMLKEMAPVKAGEAGWSVMVTADAPARAHIRDGRAAPR